MCFYWVYGIPLWIWAGEKRNAPPSKTLLVAPVSKISDLAGQMWRDLSIGICLNSPIVLSFFYSYYVTTREIVARILDAGYRACVRNIIHPPGPYLSLPWPLTIFLPPALNVRAPSSLPNLFKEARAFMAPLNIIIIIRRIYRLLARHWKTPMPSHRSIPVLNVSLASKEIFAGTIKLPLLFEVYASLIALAALSLYGCAKWFERESTIFRET